MALWLLLVSLAVPAELAADCGVSPDTIVQLRNERITGSLELAEAEARRLLECPHLDAESRRALQLELARILDRVGLHRNTRPVEEALELLRQAEGEADADDTADQATIALALAEYFYRAGLSQREFTAATEHARRAQDLFRELDDPVGQTDAVHRLGLIELQQHNLQQARELFDRSLELSEKGPYRAIFLSDYHRHVGFLDRLAEDWPAAIAHFERSLAYRNEAGSADYGLFARTMLGSALVDGGRAAEARPYLEEALRIAREIPSPVGELRATYYSGEMSEALGEPTEALAAYRRADDLATELGVASFRNAAREGLLRLMTLPSE
jgi:tetratricopeptide (TPR) repeat protein